MKVTKKNIIIETTNTVHGCLEQGGICGRKVAYPIADCEQATGLTAADLATADPDAEAPGLCCITIREIIEKEVPGRTIDKGVIIQ